MNNNKIEIKRIINTFLNWEIPSNYIRKKDFYFSNKLRKVYTIIWPRRSWKTFFCYEIINELLQNGINKKNILYFNLENDEIFPLELKDLNTILESYFEITWKLEEKVYLFLDEIQEVPNWEKFVRKVLDNYSNIEIIITGSSSTLLSREIATTLRWRSINYEMLPLLFEEYLKFKSFSKENIWIKEKIKLNILKKDFLIYWGFPEVVLEDNQILKKQILKDYFDLIFYKDIVDRNNFKSLKNLKLFRKLLISNMWDYLSINNISKITKIENITLRNWLEAFKNSYFIFELKKLNFSIMEMEKSRSKLYLVDNWFYTLSFWWIKEDFWKLLENIVFLELRKKDFIENENIFYFITKSWYEIDFITFKDGIIKAYQVSYDISLEKTRERELRALKDLQKQFWKKISEYNLVIYEEFPKTKIDWINIINFIDL